MTQADVMEYLDANVGMKFTARQLGTVFDGKMIPENVFRAVKQIIKREEYCAEVIMLNGKPTAIYGRR